MKYCTDCKYFDAAYEWRRDDACWCPDTRSPTGRYVTALSARDGGLCGLEAKFFEPKSPDPPKPPRPTFWQRIQTLL